MHQFKFTRQSVIPLVTATVAIVGTPPLVQAGVVHTADSNTILLWHLDETGFVAGEDTQDAGANNLDGSVFDDGVDNSPQTVFPSTTAVAGGAYEFKGPSFNGGTTRNLVRETAIDSHVSGTGAFTFEVWARVADLADFNAADTTLGQVLAEQRDGTTIDWSLGLQPVSGNPNQLQLRFFQNISGNQSHDTPLNWSADTWYYLALVSDPSASGLTANQSQYTLYRRELNGALSQVDQFVSNKVDAPVDVLFRLGGEPSTTSNVDRSFDGLLDEVHFSNIARSQGYLASNSVVPEPGSLMLLGAGGLGLLARRRR